MGKALSWMMAATRFEHLGARVGLRARIQTAPSFKEELTRISSARGGGGGDPPESVRLSRCPDDAPHELDLHALFLAFLGEGGYGFISKLGDHGPRSAALHRVWKTYSLAAGLPEPTELKHIMPRALPALYAARLLRLEEAVLEEEAEEGEGGVAAAAAGAVLCLACSRPTADHDENAEKHCARVLQYIMASEIMELMTMQEDLVAAVQGCSRGGGRRRAGVEALTGRLAQRVSQLLAGDAGDETTLAVMGDNGLGKSTFFNLLVRALVVGARAYAAYSQRGGTRDREAVEAAVRAVRDIVRKATAKAKAGEGDDDEGEEDDHEEDAAGAAAAAEVVINGTPVPVDMADVELAELVAAASASACEGYVGTPAYKVTAETKTKDRVEEGTYYKDRATELKPTQFILPALSNYASTTTVVIEVAHGHTWQLLTLSKPLAVMLKELAEVRHKLALLAPEKTDEELEQCAWDLRNLLVVGETEFPAAPAKPEDRGALLQAVGDVIEGRMEPCAAAAAALGQLRVWHGEGQNAQQDRLSVRARLWEALGGHFAALLDFVIVFAPVPVLHSLNVRLRDAPGLGDMSALKYARTANAVGTADAVLCCVRRSLKVAKEDVEMLREQFLGGFYEDQPSRLMVATMPEKEEPLSLDQLRAGAADPVRVDMVKRSAEDSVVTIAKAIRERLHESAPDLVTIVADVRASVPVVVAYPRLFASVTVCGDLPDYADAQAGTHIPDVLEFMAVPLYLKVRELAQWYSNELALLLGNGYPAATAAAAAADDDGASHHRPVRAAAAGGDGGGGGGCGSSGGAGGGGSPWSDKALKQVACVANRKQRELRDAMRESVSNCGVIPSAAKLDRLIKGSAFLEALMAARASISTALDKACARAASKLGWEQLGVALLEGSGGRTKAFSVAGVLEGAARVALDEACDGIAAALEPIPNECAAHAVEALEQFLDGQAPNAPAHAFRHHVADYEGQFHDEAADALGWATAPKLKAVVKKAVKRALEERLLMSAGEAEALRGGDVAANKELLKVRAARAAALIVKCLKDYVASHAKATPKELSGKLFERRRLPRMLNDAKVICAAIEGATRPPPPPTAIAATAWHAVSARTPASGAVCVSSGHSSSGNAGAEEALRAARAAVVELLEKCSPARAAKRVLEAARAARATDVLRTGGQGILVAAAQRGGCALGDASLTGGARELHALTRVRPLEPRTAAAAIAGRRNLRLEPVPGAPDMGTAARAGSAASSVCAVLAGLAKASAPVLTTAVLLAVRGAGGAAPADTATAARFTAAYGVEPAAYADAAAASPADGGAPLLASLVPLLAVAATVLDTAIDVYVAAPRTPHGSVIYRIAPSGAAVDAGGPALSVALEVLGDGATVQVVGVVPVVASAAVAGKHKRNREKDSDAHAGGSSAGGGGGGSASKKPRGSGGGE